MNCRGPHRMKAYPSVFIYYANDPAEADIILNDCIKSGFIHISDNSLATCREFDKVVMQIDESFYYDEEGFLRSAASGSGAASPVSGPETEKDTGHNVRRLFHGLNRAKSALSVIVINNPDVFDTLLTIAQGH